jgi:hypothetical protein
MKGTDDDPVAAARAATRAGVATTSAARTGRLLAGRGTRGARACGTPASLASPLSPVRARGRLGAWHCPTAPRKMDIGDTVFVDVPGRLVATRFGQLNSGDD